MFCKVVISLLVLALFALSATGMEEQPKERRISRLRNRPGFFEVEGSQTAERRPLGLLDTSAERYARSNRESQLKASKAEDSASIAKRSKTDKDKKAKADRQASSTVDMSMSMNFPQIEMSMNMDFRQMDMSLSMRIRQVDMSMSMSM